MLSEFYGILWTVCGKDLWLQQGSLWYSLLIVTTIDNHYNVPSTCGPFYFL